MANTIRIKRKIGGVAAPSAPAGANLEGELAAFFPGNAGDATKPVLYINDGGTWRVANPDAPAGTTVNFATAAEITAGTVANKAIAPDQLDAAGIGPVAFSTAAEIDAATVTDKAVAPDQLRAATLNAPTATPANDANKLIRLDATGKIATGFLSINGLDFGAAIDASAAGTVPPTTPSAGDLHFISAGGTLDGAGWSANLGANHPVNAGDSLLFDGTNWHVLEGSLDPNAYVAKAGNNAVATDMKLTWTAPAVDGTVIIDGANATKSSIDNVTIDCGTY